MVLSFIYTVRFRRFLSSARPYETHRLDENTLCLHNDTSPFPQLGDRLSISG